MNKPKTLQIEYETNPFRLGKNGVRRLLDNNRQAALALIFANLILLIINSSAQQTPGQKSGAREVLLSLGVSGLSAFLSLGAVHVALSSLRGKTLKLGDVLGQAAEDFLLYIGYVAVYTMIVIGGLILLIIPGLAFAAWYSLVLYTRLDNGPGLRAALSRSKQLVKGREIEFIAVSLVGAFYSLFGLAGPGLTSAVVGEWYGQLTSARDNKKTLPPVSRASYAVLVVGLLLVALLGAALVASASKALPK